ncbi:MAG: hypothetical protein O6922_03360 [Chloroflexi bacterium]|nr:hypothetical protein [Chloroflexota bacterium]
MPLLEHKIDISSIPHQPGQSTDLEPKRQRAWARLSDEEKEWVLTAWDLTGMIPTAPAFREMPDASNRVLYVLVGTEESLTPGELSYLMIARWFRNIDPATARAKMAALVRQGLARHTGVGRTMATEPGLEKLEEMARPPRRERGNSSSGRGDERGESGDDRGGGHRKSVGDGRGRAAWEGRGPLGSQERGGRGARRGPRRDDFRDNRGSSRYSGRGNR